jgi:flavin reductase (DIM6/NTAB) family NADH-FMN oxidoreductase RutF
MIDPSLKRCLGQMMHGVQVVGARHGDLVRAYTSHWVMQASFAEPIVIASVSPRHDTWPLIEATGTFTVSVLAGDQVDAGQYFSYPGRKFHHIASEFLEELPESGLPIVANCIAWLRCAVEDRHRVVDHELLVARVVEAGAGRLRTPPLLYSSRLGWRISGDRAREPGTSVRDVLLDRVREAGHDVSDDTDVDDGES